MHQRAWLVASTALSSLIAKGSDGHGLARYFAWLSRCQLHQGLSEDALFSAAVALDASDDKASALAQYARLNIARALRQKGQLSSALRLLALWVSEFPDHPLLRAQLADCVCKVHGDWQLATRLRKPLTNLPTFRHESNWFSLNCQLFCGAKTPEGLSRDIRDFAQSHRPDFRDQLSIGSSAPTSHASRRPQGRVRIGLVSTLFRASPVYFLCIGALRYLATEMDLVFFSRETGDDWATAELRSIASEWHDVKELDVPLLDSLFRHSQLHALIDMSGWLDPVVMQVLAMRPVARQYKWVGGQSSTTGSSAFDGFICDEHQAPASLAHLYSEPLLPLPGGYVTYTAPPYTPVPQPSSDLANASAVAGVISHPLKISSAFLAYLAQQITLHNQGVGTPINLQFVGWRYAESALQRRIHAALQLDADARREQVQVSFVPTQGHHAQMSAVAALDWVIDTFPYTSGLTALEALALGVPFRTHAGAHFSARHAYSHARYAGLRDSDISLQQLGPFGPSSLKKTGRTLLPENSPRKDHQRLACDLARALHSSLYR